MYLDTDGVCERREVGYDSLWLRLCVVDLAVERREDFPVLVLPYIGDFSSSF